MSERRTQKRKHILYYLKVYDQYTGDLLGQMADITTKGLNLISQEPVDSGRFYTLRMDLPSDVSGKSEIQFKAKSMWCKPDINPNFYSIGLQFVHISEDDTSIIESLIEDFSFQD